MDIQKNIASLYERIQYKQNENKSTCRFLNFGYWKETNNSTQASINLIKLVLELLPESRKGLNVLDCATGLGASIPYIYKHFEEANIFGIDIIENHIDKAQIHVGEISNLCIADATKMPFQDNYFDYIICIEAAFHFNTREMFLLEAFRVLKPGGILLFTDCLPHDQLIKRLDKKRIKENIGISENNLYSLKHLMNIINKTGLQLIDLVDISNYVIPYAAIEMFEGNGWRYIENIYLDRYDNLELIKSAFSDNTSFAEYYIVSCKK
jgi:ubiquinone/menaquinone biosynthesis C-methylase UbiE